MRPDMARRPGRPGRCRGRSAAAAALARRNRHGDSLPELPALDPELALLAMAVPAQDVAGGLQVAITVPLPS